VSGTPRFALTAFFYAVINGRKYPAQQTISADSPSEFGEVLEAFWEAFIPQEGDVVVYEPREVSGGYAARSSAAAGAPAAPVAPPRVEGPVCPFHGTPTTQKKGPNGFFFSCSKKREDGSWCNWRPPVTGENA
jgi:hypothetical protein